MALAKQSARYLFTGLVLATSIGCDQATKAVARDQLGDGVTHTFFSGAVRLLHAENPGAFLGMGKNLPESLRLAMLIGGVGFILLVVAYMLFQRLKTETGRFPSLISTGMGLLLAGGVGNLIDRSVGASTVTDFVQLKIGPLSSGVFNVADVFIIIGAVAVGIAAFKADPPGELPSASDLDTRGSNERAETEAPPSVAFASTPMRLA